jgi:xanthine/uracil permease
MIESLGMFLALGEITGKSIDQASLTRGTFPYISFSQNVGLVRVTGVRSRRITVTGGY